MIGVISAFILLQASPSASCEGVTYKSPDFGRCLQETIDNSKRTPDSGDVLFRELSKLKGKPQQVAFDKLGYPDRQLRVAGRLVYIWEKTEPDDLRCTVKVITEKARIIDTDFNGNAGACSYFARRLDSTFRGRY